MVVAPAGCCCPPPPPRCAMHHRSAAIHCRARSSIASCPPRVSFSAALSASTCRSSVRSANRSVKLIRASRSCSTDDATLAAAASPSCRRNTLDPRPSSTACMASSGRLFPVPLAQLMRERSGVTRIDAACGRPDRPNLRNAEGRVSSERYSSASACVFDDGRHAAAVAAAAGSSLMMLAAVAAAAGWCSGSEADGDRVERRD